MTNKHRSVLALRPLCSGLLCTLLSLSSNSLCAQESATLNPAKPEFESAGKELTAEQLATNINTRPSNPGRTGEMHFTVRNNKGRQRERTAVLLLAEKPEMTKLAIHFIEPAAIRGIGFLNHNAETGPDQSWLYLPATDRIRRLPASDRGDNFMGTDLTFGDLQDNFKFADDDWEFTSIAATPHNGKTLFALEGRARPSAMKSMGYSSFAALVDPNTLFPVQLTYTDTDGEPLKQLEILEQELIDGAWTATKFTVENLQNGHFTEVILRKMRAAPNLDMSRLESTALDMGAPDLG